MIIEKIKCLRSDHRFLDKVDTMFSERCHLQPSKNFLLWKNQIISLDKTCIFHVFLQIFFLYNLKDRLSLDQRMRACVIQSHPLERKNLLQELNRIFQIWFKNEKSYKILCHKKAFKYYFLWFFASQFRLWNRCRNPVLQKFSSEHRYNPS